MIISSTLKATTVLYFTTAAAYDLAIATDSKSDIKEIYESLSELHYDLKDYKKAYEFHLQYSELQEDIFSIDQFDKLREMEAKYPISKSKEQIESITDSNKKLKK